MRPYALTHTTPATKTNTTTHLKTKTGPKRLLQALFVVAVFLAFELNVFFLKHALWVPPTNALVTLHLLLWFAAGLPAVTVAPAPGGGQQYSLSIQVLFLMTALTLLPAALLMTVGAGVLRGVG